MKDPKQFAIDFIKPYIKRGDSIDSLIRGAGGMVCDEEEVSIGGYIYHGDRLVYKGKRHEILVGRINGANCCYIYNIYKLAKEIQLEISGITQTTLFQVDNSIENHIIKR